jgi:hypothetical protein
VKRASRLSAFGASSSVSGGGAGHRRNGGPQPAASARATAFRPAHRARSSTRSSSMGAY